MATPGGRLVLSAGRYIGCKKICVCLSNPHQFFWLFKSQRLRKSSNFENFRSREVQSVYCVTFILKSLERPILNESCHSAAGEIEIITSRKISNEVTKNWIRWLVLEAFGLHGKYFEQSHDYLFISLRAIGTKSNKEITSAILNAVESR
jgi:RNase P protein component